MATLTVRGVDDALHARLRVRAARHGRSMEAEVRAILEEELAGPRPASGLGSLIHRRFSRLGGVELGLPERTEAPRAADLSA